MVRQARTMKWIIGIAVFVAVPCAAQAAPIYLKCQIDNGEVLTEVQVTADEAMGKVSVFIPYTGKTSNMSAIFRPAEVIFSDRFGSYRIDRRTLVIERSLAIIHSVDKGKCAVEKAVERAF